MRTAGSGVSGSIDINPRLDIITLSLSVSTATSKYAWHCTVACALEFVVTPWLVFAAGTASRFSIHDESFRTSARSPGPIYTVRARCSCYDRLTIM